MTDETTPRNHGMPWTREHDAALLRIIRCRKSIAFAMEWAGRTRESITSRLDKLAKAEARSRDTRAWLAPWQDEDHLLQYIRKQRFGFTNRAVTALHGPELPEVPHIASAARKYFVDCEAKAFWGTVTPKPSGFTQEQIRRAMQEAWSDVSKIRFDGLQVLITDSLNPQKEKPMLSKFYIILCPGNMERSDLNRREFKKDAQDQADYLARKHPEYTFVVMEATTAHSIDTVDRKTLREAPKRKPAKAEK